MTFEEFDRQAKAGPSFEDFDRMAREPADRGFVQTLKDTLAEGYKAAEPARTSGQKFLQLIVPTTPTGVGGAAGTAAGAKWLTPLLSKIPQLGRAAAPAARVLGASTLGEVGGEVEGRPFGAGAAEEGIAATGGEALGKAVPWIRARIGGGRERVNLGDTANIGKVLPPSLGAPKSATEMWEAAVAAPRRLGNAKEAAVQEVESLLPGGAPSRFKTPGEPPPGIAEPGEWMAAQAAAGERSRFAQALGPTEIDIPSLGQSMTLREANDVLSQRGAVLSGRAALDPRFKDRDPARAYKALAQDIDSGVQAHGGDEALNKWQSLQDAYKAGRAEIKPFQRGAAYLPGQQEGEAQLSLVQVASWLREPKNAAWMINRIGRPRFDAMLNEITRGAGPLATDIMEPGRGRMTDALMQWLRGTNTGSTQAIGVPLRTPIPGVGRQYAGRPPMALPASLQAILDVAMQRAGGAALGGQR